MAMNPTAANVASSPSSVGTAPPSPPPRRIIRGRRWRPNQSSLLWALPALILVGAVFYVGVGSGAIYAFTNWNGLSTTAKFIGLHNFRELLHDPVARQALEHTITIAVGFVVIVNVGGLALALALRRTIKSRVALRAVMFAPVVVSPLALAYVWQFIFQYNGPLNIVLKGLGLKSLTQAWLSSPHWAIYAVFVVLIWQYVGLAMVIYIAGLESIPEELDEAAAVDGAGVWFRFRRVTFPMLAPSMTIAVTLTLVIGLRVFDQVWALTGGGPINSTETLATQVYEQTFSNGQFGYGTALALVLTILVALAGIAQMTILRSREKRIG